MGDETRVIVDLGAGVASAGVARTTLRAALVDLPDDTVETVCLLAHELVANVLLHVGTPLQMTIVRTDDAVRVEVADPLPDPPQQRSTRLQDLTGRGLRLLDDLADEWGTIQHPGDGKTVWFALGLPRAATEPGAPAGMS